MEPSSRLVRPSPNCSVPRADGGGGGVAVGRQEDQQAAAELVEARHARRLVGQRAGDGQRGPAGHVDGLDGRAGGRAEVDRAALDEGVARGGCRARATSRRG